jgi:hypothetical protein
MSKENAKIVKIVNKAKVNTYTKVECESELRRMQIKTKDQNDPHKSGDQTNSKYYKDVAKQLALLS